MAACHRLLNLDRPVHLRYIEWMVNFAQGDMGKTLTNHREVVDVIGNRIGNTFFLAIASALIAIPISLALGIIAALYRNSFFDRSISMITLSGISVPDFFIAYILMAIFAVSFGIFPAISNVDDSMSLGERITASALPVLTLTIACQCTHDAHDSGIHCEPDVQPLHRDGQAQRYETRTDYRLPCPAQCLVADHPGHHAESRMARRWCSDC